MNRHVKKVMIVLTVAAFALGGCGGDDDITIIRQNPDPQPPQGLTSVTGDEAVFLFWFGPYDRDLKEFIVYSSEEAEAGYEEIGRVAAIDNPDLDLIIYEYVDLGAGNGDTWYYAIASVDLDGRVSELSAEEVFDTPRPEGEVRLWDRAALGSQSGYSFLLDSIVSWDDDVADVWVDSVEGVFYLNDGASIPDFQDMGYTESFDDIGWAPQVGWSQLLFMELIAGHTYVLRIGTFPDYNYGKMRVKSIGVSSVLFQWAFQTSLNNPELAPPSDGGEGPVVIDNPNSSSANAATGQ